MADANELWDWADVLALAELSRAVIHPPFSDDIEISRVFEALDADEDMDRLRVATAATIRRVADICEP
jgi:hypothetical protein